MSNTKQQSIRIPEDLYNQLLSASKGNNWGISREIIQRLYRSFEGPIGVEEEGYRQLKKIILGVVSGGIQVGGETVEERIGAICTLLDISMEDPDVVAILEVTRE